MSRISAFMLVILAAMLILWSILLVLELKNLL